MLLTDGACSNLFVNFRENSSKRVLSNDSTDNPALFSVVNTFKLKTTRALFIRSTSSENAVLSLLV
jgi:hypothetical protein